MEEFIHNYNKIKEYFIEIKLPKSSHLKVIEKEYFYPTDAFIMFQINKNKYYYAQSDCMSIILYSIHYICAHCSQKFANDSNNKENDSIDFGEFLHWVHETNIHYGCAQDENLYFQCEPLNIEKQICPFCNANLFVSNETVSYFIYTNDNISVIMQNFDKRNLFDVFTTEKPFVNYEKKMDFFIVFNHETHNTNAIIVNEKGEIIYNKDLLKTPSEMKEYKIYHHLTNNKELRKTLNSFFEKFYHKKSHIRNSCASLEFYVYLNKFQGYPMHFYNNLPLHSKNRTINSICKDVPLEIFEFNNLSKIYYKSSLSKFKKLKQILNKNPALFLYLDTIENLPFNDINIICKLLTCKYNFDILKLLKKYDKVIFFIKIFIDEVGEETTFKIISSDNIFKLAKFAIMFLASSYKEQELISKKGIIDFYNSIGIYSSHNFFNDFDDIFVDFIFVITCFKHENYFFRPVKITDIIEININLYNNLKCMDFLTAYELVEVRHDNVLIAIISLGVKSGYYHFNKIYIIPEFRFLENEKFLKAFNKWKCQFNIKPINPKVLY